MIIISCQTGIGWYAIIGIHWSRIVDVDIYTEKLFDQSAQ